MEEARPPATANKPSNKQQSQELGGNDDEDATENARGGFSYILEEGGCNTLTHKPQRQQFLSDSSSTGGCSTVTVELETVKSTRISSSLLLVTAPTIEG